MNAPELSPLKRAFLALQEAQQRIAALESARSEPIAVVGVGARMPGGEDGPDGYWSLLREGRDAVGAGLTERWHELQAAGSDDMPESARFAALLERPDLFDAEFFGISPREAAGIDPQQRLLLEVSWEALEHAGIAPTSLYGSRTGVFVGIATSDYSLLRLATTERTEIDGHFGSDTALSIASGRISYILGLRGPAVSLDTACSSSLVATHLACEALRRGECTLALAGGVNAILSTEGSRAFARSGMLSPEGHCKSFAAAADGYVRGEGCGVIVLKRLSHAQADGDRVLAVLLGSAINHDGPSSGLTVPSGRAQQAVVRAALESANLEPRAVGYIEAHGTGTSLGDPIEAEALGAVFAQTRPENRPLQVGAVKTNIGHLEAAAGVAGLIKVVLSLAHGELPAQLHFDVPSPHIRWDALGLEIVDTHRTWEQIDGRRIAGVSSFGFSGTNAHVIVADPPAPDASAIAAERPIEILTLSARSEAALRALAQRYAARLDAQPEQWADLCHTANTGRAPFAHQLSVRGPDAATIAAGLQAFVAGKDDQGVIVSQATTVRPKIGLLFTGQGAQYAGMGRALYAASPAVRRIVDAADALLAERLDAPLGAVMRGEHPDAARLINLTLYTQPALYVLEYALAELLRELGVDPHAVIGHSLGEYAAAAATRVFSFEDGLLLVADRARLMHEVRADGAMLVISASEQQIAPLVHGYEDRVSVAGVNAPSQVTISGARAAIEEIAAACAQRGWRTVPLPVSQAFHSPLLEQMSVAFEARAAQLAYAPPNRKLVSNLTGTTVDTVDAAYWRAHTRRAVRFADGVRALDELGCDVLVEIGPRPTLLPLAQQVHGSAGARRYVATLKGAGQDWDNLAQTLQQLQAAGVTIDWRAWDRGRARRVVDAPTYPFERRRHWIAPAKRAATAARRVDASGAHSLLGARLRSALPGAQYEAELVTSGPTAWLGDHRINAGALLPATALIEIMLAAGAACDPPLPELRDLTIVAPLWVGDETRTVQTIVDAPVAGSATVRIFAAGDDARFRLHAQARLAAGATADPSPAEDLGAIRARCTRERDAEQHCAHMAQSGADFGPAFRGVTRIWSGEGEALADVHAIAGTTFEDTQRPHPALLDACLQTAAGALEHGGATYMPTALARLDLRSAVWPEHVFSHARVTLRSQDAPQLDVTVYDADGTVLARAHELSFTKIDGAVAADDAADRSSWFYDLSWRKAPVPPAADSHAAAIVVGSSPLADGIAAALRSNGRSVELHAAPDAERSIAALNGRASAAGIVVCVSPEPDSPDDGPLSGRPGVETLLALCKRHAHDGTFAQARFYVVTRNAHAVEPGDAPVLADAALSGLAATVPAEFPELRCTRVDVDPANVAAASADVAREIAAAAVDDWVAYRHGTRFAARLERLAGVERVAPGAQPVALRSAGSLDSIAWMPALRGELGPDEIEIEVVAAPLNFRDVVSAVGMFSDAMALGAECAGIVSRTGSAVTRFAIGDEVVAFAPGALASFAVVTQRLAVAKPPGLSFASAASQALVYLTADYALHAVAAMRPGERVLIHAAAGGVGLAAVELCRRAGVTIFATAGSEAKRAHLRGLGIEHVMDSRSLLFADEIRATTGGRGVVVVLNSLAGAFVDASLSVTAPGGRFIEIGKTDVRDAQDVAARYPGVTYSAVDLLDQFRDDPEQSVARLSAIYARIESGELAAVPHRPYGQAQAQTAFRDLAAARHIGKLVLTLDRSAATPVVHAGGTYLITGGLSGIGAYLAGRLVEHGAGRVVLVGRNAPSPEMSASIAAWRAGGADVIAPQADVTRYDEVAAAIRDAGPSLRGIVHCASVLDDAPIGELSWDRFAAVLGPKAQGAWNLHRATAGLQLDFFVLFSSWASLVGARGGANYAGANLALDTLAQLRHAQGLAALSIDWGAWANIGWATRVAGGLPSRPGGLPSRPGFAPMSPDQAVLALETALHFNGTAQVAIAPVDWPVLVARAGRSLPSVCADFVATAGRAAGAPAAPATVSLADALAAAAPRARAAVARAHLQDLAAKALGIEDPATIDPDRPLADLGMDSILAVELRNTVARSLRAEVATTLLFDYPTIGALTGFALALIAPDERAGETESSADDAGLLDMIERLSDAEVDRRLAQRGADVA